MFQCPVCKDCPRILICDGTALTLKKDRFVGNSISEVDTSIPVTQRIAGKRSDRSFFLNKDERVVFSSFVSWFKRVVGA